MTDSKTAIPGHLLGAVEEFEPGAGAFEEEGHVYAGIIGKPELDKDRRMGVVSPLRMEKLKKGDTVYALVKDLYDQIALLEFQPLTRKAAHSTYAFMRISEVAKGYTQRLTDALRIGDYVKAEIVDVKPMGIYLTMAAPHLGVVRAFCSLCRGEIRGGTCTKCRAHERRKWIQR